VRKRLAIRWNSRQTALSGRTASEPLVFFLVLRSRFATPTARDLQMFFDYNGEVSTFLGISQMVCAFV